VGRRGRRARCYLAVEERVAVRSILTTYKHDVRAHALGHPCPMSAGRRLPLIADLVDAETTEIRPSLSAGMRQNDLDIARENVAGSLYDLIAAGQLRPDLDPIEIVDELEHRYHSLWGELTAIQKLPGTERWRIRERIDRIDALGFDVQELRVRSRDGGSQIEIQARVVEEGHAHRRFQALTGLSIQEGQAREFLDALFAHGAMVERAEGHELPAELKAQRWLTERYYPVLAAIPIEYRGRLEPLADVDLPRPAAGRTCSP
jgi:hypothetical protein